MDEILAHFFYKDGFDTKKPMNIDVPLNKETDLAHIVVWPQELSKKILVNYFSFKQPF